MVYFSIAWKQCEHKVFSLNEIIHGIYSEQILVYGKKFYQKVKKTILEYEQLVLKDLEYRVIVPYIFDILELRLHT